MQAPSITPEMRQAAMEKALASRRKVAQAKQDLRDGKLTFQDVFDMREDDAIGRIKIIHVLQTLPGIGVTKAEAILKELRIAPTRRVRGVGARQLEGLLEIEKKYRRFAETDSDES